MITIAELRNNLKKLVSQLDNGKLKEDIIELIDNYSNIEIANRLRIEELQKTLEETNFIYQDLDFFFESAFFPIIIYDYNFHIIRTNRFFSAITSNLKIKGERKNLLNYFNSEFLKEIYFHLNEIRNSTEFVSLDIQFAGLSNKYFRLTSKKYFSKLNNKELIVSAFIDNTELKLKDQIIEKQNIELSKELFEKTKAIDSIFNENIFGLAILDENRNIKDVNDKMLNIFGYERNELINSHINIVHINNDYSNKFREQYYHQLSDTFIITEWPFKRKDGTVIMCKLNGKAIDKKDLSKGIVWILQDVSQERQYQKELEKSEIRFRSMFEFSNDAIFIMKDNIIENVNLKSEEIFRCSKNDLIGKTPYDVSPEYQENGVLSKNLASKYISDVDVNKDLQFEWTHKRFDNTVFKAKINLRKIKNNDLEFIHATVQDLSKFEEVETKLKKTERFYEVLFNSINLPIIIYTRDAEIYNQNKLSKDIFSQLNPNVNQNSLKDFFPDLYEITKIRIREALEKNSILNYLDEIETEYFGIRRISSDFIPLKNGSIKNDLVLVISYDLTELVESQKELKESESKLSKTAELAKIGYYSFNINSKEIEWSEQIFNILELDKNTISPSYKLFNELIHQEDLQKLKTDYYELAKSPCEQIREYRFIDGKGNLKYTYSYAVSLADLQGKPERIEGYLQDITSLKTAQLEKEKYKSRLSAFLNNIDDILYFQDLNGNIELYSKTEPLLSYKADDFEKDPELWNKISFKEDLERLDKFYKEKAGKVNNYETCYRLIKRDGSIIWIHSKMKAAYDKDGNIIGYNCIDRDITNSKNAEKSLKESERRLRTLIGNLQGIIYRCKYDNFFTMLYLNETVEEITGYAYDELLFNNKISFISLIHKDDLNGVVDSITDAVTNNQKFVIEYRIITKSGKTKWLWEKGVSLIDEVTGSIILEGFINDITQRKEFEIALKESEIRFRTYIESAPVGIHLVDKDGNFIYTNNDFSKQIEADNEVEAKINFRDLHSQEEVEYYQQVFETLKETGNVKFEAKIKTLKGNPRYLQINSVILPDSKILAFSLDITEIKTAQEKLRLNEEQMRLATNAANQGLWEYSVKNSFFSLNNILLNFLTLNSANNILDFDTFTSYINDFDREFFIINLNNLIFGNTKECKIELRCKSKSGDFHWFLTHIETVDYDEYGSPLRIMGSQIDISEQKKIQHELKQANIELSENNRRIEAINEELIKAKDYAEKADKMKSDFLAQMSHEIRTPVGAIMNFSELMKSLSIHSDDDTISIFNGIENSGKRIIRTVNLILNASDIQSGTYEYLPKKVCLIKDILKPLYSEFVQLANSKSLSFNLLFGEEIDLFIDEYSVTQIFANLIDNAIKYTKVGFVKINVYRENSKKIIVEVEDSGIGIAEEFKPRLFEAFSQEETGYTRKYEGSGLGLALVKKYCDINNARIDVYSQKGLGTKFKVTFYI